MSASWRGRSKDDYAMNKGRQESAVGARDDGGDSTSLSPASRVLAIADQLAEEELRDKTGGDNGGSSGIYSTSEDGSSDGSLVFRSKRETCGPQELLTGANQREKRRGYIQQRRGRHEKSSARRTYHPLGLASPAASRASSDDSWRQEILKDRKNSPADRTHHENEREEGSLTCKPGKASEALVDGDLGEVGNAGVVEDDVERMSLAGLKSTALELGLPINGRKQQLKVRIKARLRSMSVPRCAAVAVDPASPVKTSAEPGIAPVDSVKTPLACAHAGEDARIEEEESPLLADTTTVLPRGEGSEETARLTSESAELALGEAEFARVNNAEAAKAVPATVSEESPPASPLSLLEEGATVPREKPKLPADEALPPRRERRRGVNLEGEREGGAATVLNDSRATEVEGRGGDRTDSGEGMGEGFPVGARSPRGEPRVETAAAITEADSEGCDERGRESQEAEEVDAGAHGCRPQTEDASEVGEKPVGGSAALAGGRSSSPEREGSDSEDSANVDEVLASGLRRAAGDSSVLFESGGRSLEGKMEEVTTVEAHGRRVPGRERREEGSGVELEKHILRSLEDTGRDSHGSNEQQPRDVALLAGDSQGTARESATKGVMKYKMQMEWMFGERGRTQLAGISEGSTADVKAASTVARALGKPFHRNMGARGEADPGVPRRALEGRNWRAVEVKDPPSAQELEAKFRALERLCAPYLSGGKSSPFPGYTLLPETKAHKKNIGRLAVWLDARANGRGSRDGCASRTRISSDARKIPAAVPLARRDRPATLERASKPSRIDVGGGGLTRAERTKDDGKRAMPARSFGKSGSFSDVGSTVAGGSVRAPRSSSSSAARVPQPSRAATARPAASSAAGAGGSTRLLRGGNRPNDRVREAHASPTASKTRTHFRGKSPATSAAATAAATTAAPRRLTKSGGRRSSTASRLGPPTPRRNPLTRDSTTPRPPRVSVSRSGIGKMGAAAVAGRRSSTASRRGSTAIREDVKGGQGRRDSKGVTPATPPRIQRHRRNPGTAHVARSRKPSLSLAEPRPSKTSSGLATTSKLPRRDGTGDFLARRQSVRGRGSVTPPRQGARGANANGVATPRSGKNRSALQVFGIDTSMPTPPRIGQRLRNASFATKNPMGGRSAPRGDAKK